MKASGGDESRHRRFHASLRGGPRVGSVSTGRDPRMNTRCEHGIRRRKLSMAWTRVEEPSKWRLFSATSASPAAGPMQMQRLVPDVQTESCEGSAWRRSCSAAYMT
jgi:hypothetical protein